MEKILKITIKAIWLAIKDLDFISVLKLLNFRKNSEFIACVELFLND